MLTPGARIGPYEIVDPIGAGGMGEVYRARDGRLGRDVAIKVLPPEYSGDRQRLQRFEQEARAAAALNHPNLLAVYDIGTQDGAPYIVSELLKGESLRQRLRGGPLPPRKAIDYAVQIAHGLAAAHEAGIVHRDLKPENVFLTGDGRVKILDFGLAKLTASSLEEGATAATEMTLPGAMLGTIGYMAPEQVRGLDTDARSDIFAFGAVLHEMVSGQRAFSGPTPADTLDAILHGDPPSLGSETQQIAPGLQRIVQHCLEKSPAERFQSAHDIAFALHALTGSDAQPAVPAVPSWRRWWMPAAAAAVAVVLGAVIFVGGRVTVQQTRPEYHQLTYRRGSIGNARFMPDGQNIVYTARWDGGRREMYTVWYEGVDSRSLDMPESELLGVSPKGELAVVNGGTLATVPFAGGTPREIERRVLSADWGPDGSDMAIIRRVDVPGEVWGDVVLEYPRGKVLYHRDPRSDATSLHHVRVSPDGTHLAFFSDFGGAYARATIIDTSGRKLAQSGVYGLPFGLAWAPSSREVWFAGMWHSRLTVLALDLSGRTRVVLHVPVGLVVKDISREGTLLLTREDQTIDIIGRPAGAAKERSLGWYGWSLLSDMSSDGQYVAFAEGGTSGTDWGMYIRKTDGSAAVRLGTGAYGKLSPDGKWLAFAWDPSYQMDADPDQLRDEVFLDAGVIRLLPVGAGAPRDLALPKLASVEVVGWLPDATPIFVAEEPGRQPRTWAAPLDGAPVRPLTPEGVLATLPTPDGAYLLWNDPPRGAALYPTDGSAPVPVQIPSSAEPIGWDASGRRLYIGERAIEDDVHTGWDISLLDPYTGTAQPWTQISFPPDRSGFGSLSAPFLSRDGQVYVYCYARRMSQLYTVKGLH